MLISDGRGLGLGSCIDGCSAQVTTIGIAGSMQEHMVHAAPLAAKDTSSANDNSFDIVSLTSTVDEEYNSDTEFAVEGIRAEKIIDGAHMYLVEWSNFPLDQCTYEPEENLQDELKAEWEEKKRQQDPSVAEEFVEKHLDAKKQKLAESRQRHRQRNARRKQLGLPITRFQFKGTYYSDSEDDYDWAIRPEDSESEDINDKQYGSNAWKDSSESDEADEDDQIDYKAAEAFVPLKPQTKSKQPRSNRIFSFNPTTSASKKATKTDNTVKESTQASTKGPTTEIQTSKPSSRPRELPSSRAHELPSSTGYQGSARKSSSSTTLDKQLQSANISLPSRPSSAGSAKKHAMNTSLPSRPTTAGPAKTNAKQLTARRTEQQGVNIFAGGKKRKKRTVSTAPGNPRFYPTASIRRKSELRSRGREDEDPDIQKLSHIFKPGGSTVEAQPSEPPAETAPDGPASNDGVGTVAQDEMAQRSIIPRQTKRPVRTSSEPKSALSKRGSLVSDSERPEKRAKSVRFTDVNDEPTIPRELRSIRFSGADESFVREPMDIDEASELPQQNVSKSITLANSPNKNLSVVFSGVPGGPDDDNSPQWLKAFLDADCLSFYHAVLAETLMFQFTSLGPQALEHLCSGIITSTEDNTTLETIAEHLRIGRRGLFVAQNHFNLLMYPTKCDGFRLEDFGADFASSENSALKYFIFTSTCPLSRLIGPTESRSNSLGIRMDVGQEISMLFSKILGVRLSPLSHGSQYGKPKHFFFAFPEGALVWCRSFCCWLHQRSPKCSIYTSCNQGSWSAFAEKAKQESGVIIMHEAIVPFARRFLGLWELLQTDRCMVWRFSESLDLQNPPFLQNSFGGSVIPPLLSRMFPLGMAILVTPSFMLSQPQETFKLFKWFFAEKAKVSHNKIVTAYNIRDYLHGLAADKSHQSKLSKATRWAQMSSMDVALERNSRALTDDDVVASQRTWLEVDRWLSQQLEPNLPFSEENHVIYADPSIDPNDEQSLVNWFGWWTSVRSDTYRKFYIIGSDSSSQGATRSGYEPLSRMSRDLKIPKYGSTVVNDPDASLRVLSKTRPESLERRTSALADERGRSGWAQSQQYFSNGEGEIKGFLAHCDRTGGHTRIYRFPVAYVDMRMADHFGDPSMMACNTYKQWWDFSYPWLKDPHGRFNTYIGFFYTIQEDWIPSNFPKGLKPRRHAWIVIYRPVEPHNKNYRHGKNELIIWDVRAGDILEENYNIGLADLTWMQRELIRYVQLHAHEKAPGSVLEKVWLGGFQAHQGGCSTTLPLDRTAEFLEILVHTFKDTIPSPAKAMPSKGFRPVSFTQTSQTANTTAAREAGMDGASEETRTIFHPPRGSANPLSTGPSNCTNDLFEASRLAKSRNPNAREMTYKYRPTLEWYKQQVKEGRQFEHIRVGEWEEMFQVLGINSPGKTPTSATFPEQPLGFSRKSSLSSNHSSPKA